MATADGFEPYKLSLTALETKLAIEKAHSLNIAIDDLNNVNLKADKVVGATAGNVAELDINGNLVDSGYTFFPTGTIMLFQQTNAPVGWTKQVAHNDKALRVVSGTASAGGSYNFSTVFGKTGTDGHAISVAQMPPHNHGYTGTQGNSWPDGADDNVAVGNYLSHPRVTQLNNQGSGAPHSHTMDIRVQYVDIILASKD